MSAADDLRAIVAEAKGVPPKFADRLHGETREELEADADAFLADFPHLDLNRSRPREGRLALDEHGNVVRMAKADVLGERPDLRGGLDPTTTPSADVRSAVDAVPRGF